MNSPRPEALDTFVQGDVSKLRAELHATQVKLAEKEAELKRLRNTLEIADAEIEAAEELREEHIRLRRDFRMAQTVIAKANNSLYGSDGYFLTDKGGRPDPYHLARPIEDLKMHARAARSALSDTGEAK